MYKMTKPLERILSGEEVKEIIAYAETLRLSDRIEQGGSLSLDDVKGIASELDIPKEYIESAIKEIYVDKRKLLSQLEGMGAKPTDKIILETYRSFLFSSLRNTFPSRNFTGSWGFFSKMKIKDETKKEKIAELLYRHNLYLFVDIYSPTFTTACAPILKKLNAKFKMTVSSKFHYNPYSEENLGL